MLVSAAKHSQMKTAEGQKFVDWVTGSAGQAVITSYKIGGEQFFSERGEVGWLGSTGKFRPTTVDRFLYVNYCCAAITVGRDRELGSRCLARSCHQLTRQCSSINDRYLRSSVMQCGRFIHAERKERRQCESPRSLSGLAV
jgi:hypothetical protein